MPAQNTKCSSVALSSHITNQHNSLHTAARATPPPPTEKRQRVYDGKHTRAHASTASAQINCGR